MNHRKFIGVNGQKRNRVMDENLFLGDIRVMVENLSCGGWSCNGRKFIFGRIITFGFHERRYVTMKDIMILSCSNFANAKRQEIITRRGQDEVRES